MAPGDKLSSERELSEQLGVGRPAVREALKTINALGLVEIRQYDGVYVASFEDKSLTLPFKVQMDMGQFNLNHLFEARRLFEVEAAAIAVAHITNEEISSIKSVVEATSIDDYEQFVASDARFHSLIYKATRNVFLCSVMEVISELSLPSQKIMGKDKKTRELVHSAHLQIVAAFQDRSADKSRNAMLLHIEHLQKIAEANTEICDCRL